MTDRPYLTHLSCSDDLLTTPEAVRAGFIALALERSRRASPYVEQARVLKHTAQRASTPSALMHNHALATSLLTAAGVSDKAAHFLEETDKAKAIQELISQFLEPKGQDFVDEFVFRYLLTRGDTLGGSMRNVGGALAQRRFTRTLLSVLQLAQTPLQGLQIGEATWSPLRGEEVDIENRLRGFTWKGEQGERTLLYNVTVPIIKNNVDVCLMSGTPQELGLLGSNEVLTKKPEAYLVLGELKGGIDPAGADEHWKTAKTALNRIQKAFALTPHTPALFFAGASVVKKMAQEIWEDLAQGNLTNAANLSDSKQVTALCLWLLSQ